jgi:hypothetical protein
VSHATLAPTASTTHPFIPCQHRPGTPATCLQCSQIATDPVHDWLTPITSEELVQLENLPMGEAWTDTRIPIAHHSKDSDCTVSEETECCEVCGVSHSDECLECGARGFHKSTCVLKLGGR